MADPDTATSYYGYSEVADDDTITYYVQKENTIVPTYYEPDESSALPSEAELIDSLGPPPAYTDNSTTVESEPVGYTDNSSGYGQWKTGTLIWTKTEKKQRPKNFSAVRLVVITGFLYENFTHKGYSENTGYAVNSSNGYAQVETPAGTKESLFFCPC
jgi:hypothetical protein